MATGRSLHIGLNSLDADHYDGWEGELAGCVNDALDMDSVAYSQGFQRRMLLNEDATRSRVIGEIEEAIGSSSAGDVVLVTFSGHGSQIPDQNGDETDGQDETWCLFDGELLDDELWRLWIKAKEHVRIVVLSDSCHSGTILELGPMTALRDSRTKNLPPTLAERVYRKHRDRYDSITSLPAPELSQLEASVLLLSASLDREKAWEGYGNGEFTSALLRVWNGGQFAGNYRDLHRRVRRLLSPRQTPELLVLGNHTGAFVSQTPFSI